LRLAFAAFSFFLGRRCGIHTFTGPSGVSFVLSDISRHEHTRAGEHLRLSICYYLALAAYFLGHGAFGIFWLLMMMAFKIWEEGFFAPRSVEGISASGWDAIRTGLDTYLDMGLSFGTYVEAFWTFLHDRLQRDQNTLEVSTWFICR
jgi:hypothetical protein